MMYCEPNPTVKSNTDKYLAGKGLDWEILSISDRISLLSKLETHCKSCPLRYESVGSVPSEIRPDSEYLFLGRNPNKSEARANKLYPSGTAQGSIFYKYLEFLGVGQSQCSMVNMCNCSSQGNAPVTPYEVSQCSYLTRMAIDCLPNIKVIFPLGVDAIRWVLDSEAPTVMRSLGDVYKIVLSGHEVLVAPLPHPSMCLVDKEVAQSAKNILLSVRSALNQT